MILEYEYINVLVPIDNGTEWWENNEIVPSVEDTFDRTSWQNLIYSLSQDQTELLICRYLGLNPTETVKALHLKNIGKYYALNFRLHDTYKKRKKYYIDI